MFEKSHSRILRYNLDHRQHRSPKKNVNTAHFSHNFKNRVFVISKHKCFAPSSRNFCVRPWPGPSNRRAASGFRSYRLQSGRSNHYAIAPVACSYRSTVKYNVNLQYKNSQICQSVSAVLPVSKIFYFTGIIVIFYVKILYKLEINSIVDVMTLLFLGVEVRHESQSRFTPST